MKLVLFRDDSSDSWPCYHPAMRNLLLIHLYIGIYRERSSAICAIRAIVGPNGPVNDADGVVNYFRVAVTQAEPQCGRRTPRNPVASVSDM